MKSRRNTIGRGVCVPEYSTALRRATVLAWAWVAFAVCGPARAQVADTTAWKVVVEGERWPWMDVRGAADSLEAVWGVTAAMHRSGFFRARVVSVHPDDGRVEVDPGVRALVGALRVAGPSDVPFALDSLSGQPFSATGLAGRIGAYLEALERHGRVHAAVRVARFALIPESGLLEIDLAVEQGPHTKFAGLLLSGARRTAPRTIERLLGLRPFQPIGRFDRDDIAGRLAASGLFTDVASPVLLAVTDSSSAMQLIVTEAAPGAFDAALGWQPRAGPSGGGLVGSGRLELVNPFGGARRFSLLFERLPGQLSRAHVTASDPALLVGWLGADMSFRGLQQDSTFGKRALGLAGHVEVADGLRLSATVASERVRPGTSGAQVVAGRQRIARSDVGALGFGFRFTRIDDRLNPSRGLQVEALAERGWVRRSAREASPPDTLLIGTRHRLERLSATARWYVPVGARGTVALGLDGSVVATSGVDRGDLVRMGGARSLRGYDEDRFEGRAVGRLFAEWRRRLDGPGYAYLFCDLGFVDVPPLEGLTAGSSTYPGFGLGAQLDTAAGLVLATYGFNPEDGPLRGRVHVSFSFGL